MSGTSATSATAINKVVIRRILHPQSKFKMPNYNGDICMEGPIGWAGNCHIAERFVWLIGKNLHLRLVWQASVGFRLDLEIHSPGSSIRPQRSSNCFVRGGARG